MGSKSDDVPGHYWNGYSWKPYADKFADAEDKFFARELRDDVPPLHPNPNYDAEQKSINTDHVGLMPDGRLELSIARAESLLAWDRMAAVDDGDRQVELAHDQPYTAHKVGCSDDACGGCASGKLVPMPDIPHDPAAYAYRIASISPMPAAVTEGAHLATCPGGECIGCRPVDSFDLHAVAAAEFVCEDQHAELLASDPARSSELVAHELKDIIEEIRTAPPDTAELLDVLDDTERSLEEMRRDRVVPDRVMAMPCDAPLRGHKPARVIVDDPDRQSPMRGNAWGNTAAPRSARMNQQGMHLRTCTNKNCTGC